MCSLFIDIYASVLQFPSIKSVKWIKVKAVNTVRHLRIQESINDSITIQRTACNWSSLFLTFGLSKQPEREYTENITTITTSWMRHSH